MLLHYLHGAREGGASSAIRHYQLHGTRSGHCQLWQRVPGRQPVVTVRARRCVERDRQAFAQSESVASQVRGHIAEHYVIDEVPTTPTAQHGA